MFKAEANLLFRFRNPDIMMQKRRQYLSLEEWWLPPSGLLRLDHEAEIRHETEKEIEMGRSQQKKVLCFGLVMADVLVSGLERLPGNWEEAVGGDRSVIAVGGGATNSARTFARLGESVDLLGRVGGDYFGEFVRKNTEAFGVDCSALASDQERTTGVAVGLIHKNGKRCFVTAQGANRGINKTDFERVNLGQYDFMHINGFFQFPEIEADLRQILQNLHAMGGLVSLDTAASDPFDRWYAAVEPFIDCIDYLFLNDSQMKKMTGKDTVEEGAKALLAAGVKHVIAKLGRDGCVIYDEENEPLHVPSLDVKAVDTTGAGDSFDAAYIMGLRRGWSAVRCARFANTVAGLNCCRLGATAGVPDWATAVQTMNDFYGTKGYEKQYG